MPENCSQSDSSGVVSEPWAAAPKAKGDSKGDSESIERAA